jgi:hypothetical protein
MIIHYRPLILVALLAVLPGLVGAGCHSTAPSRPDVDSLAFIEVRGHSSVETARVLSEVFREAGYMPVAQSPTKSMSLVFERPGTTTESVFYGDWSGKVWYRVKIKIETPDADLNLVKCDTYRIVGHGDPRFEEETKVSFGKGKYQELLDRAQARLAGR